MFLGIISRRRYSNTKFRRRRPSNAVEGSVISTEVSHRPVAAVEKVETGRVNFFFLFLKKFFRLNLLFI